MWAIYRSRLISSVSTTKSSTLSWQHRSRRGATAAAAGWVADFSVVAVTGAFLLLSPAADAEAEVAAVDTSRHNNNNKNKKKDSEIANHHHQRRPWQDDLKKISWLSFFPTTNTTTLFSMLPQSADTQCESAAYSNDDGGNGLLPAPSSSSSSSTSNTSRFQLRRHLTMQKLQQSATLDSLQSKYTVQWKKPLGEGTFGAVYMGIHKTTGEAVAVKKIPKRCTDQETFQREMDALLKLRDAGGHPNICGLRENFEEGNYFYLVLDLIQGGEMFDQLCSHGPYSEADAARLVREVASALAFLHGIGIVHGDMKPENVMLSSETTSDAVIQVVDFGCAQVYDDAQPELSKRPVHVLTNTPAYTPPEILQLQNQKNKRSALNSIRIDPTLDMWALGVIIYIMLTGVHPFDLYGNATDEEIMQSVLSKKKPPLYRSPLTSHLSPDAISVIDKLLQWDPKKRLSADQLLEHPWVRGETASRNKMAHSDKKLSSFRQFKTKIGEKVFRDMFYMSARSSRHKVVNKDGSSSSSGGGITHPQNRKTVGGKEWCKRTSLMEQAFKNLDANHDGYLSTAELRNLTKGGSLAVIDTKAKPATTGAGVGPATLPTNVTTTTTATAGGPDDHSEQMTLSDFSTLLAENMKNRYFPKGHIIYHEGEIGNAMYFLNSGAVEVYSKDGFRKALREPGAFFGEGALLNPNRIRSATIRCLTPVHVIEVSREYFEKYLAADLDMDLDWRAADRVRKQQRVKNILHAQHNLQNKNFNKNDLIFQAGEATQDVYVLEEGQVGIWYGHQCMFLIEPGSMFGAHAYMFDRLRNVTAKCHTDQCITHMLRAADFQQLLKNHPALRENMREVVCKREFQKALCAATHKPFPKTEQELRATYDSFVNKQTGNLELDDVRRILHDLDPTFSEKDVKDILHALDLKENGAVEWYEFKRLFDMEDILE